MVFSRRALFAALVLVGCEPSPRARELRFWTDDLMVRVSSEPLPPHAAENIVYRVTVQDKKTGQPIENGEGQIFATSRDRVNTWDSFEPANDIGTYYAKLRFMTAGEWAVAIRFRRDSTQALQRLDWRQEVRAPRGPGA
jgi:hypothetical protein